MSSWVPLVAKIVIPICFTFFSREAMHGAVQFRAPPGCQPSDSALLMERGCQLVDPTQLQPARE